MKTFDETNGSASVEETIPLISAVPEDNEEKKKDEDETSKEDKEKYANIRTENIGVWRIFYQDTPWSFLPGAETARKFRELVDGVPFVWRFLVEVWALAPGHLIIWALISVWESTQGAISLWVTAQILQTMQNIILSGKGDMKAVRYALGIKFLHGVSEIVHRRISDKCHKTLKRRITRHCGAHLLDVYARMDLVTLQRKDVQNKLSKTSHTFLGDAIWRSFCELMEQVTGILEIASQGWFLASFFRTQENGWILAAVCVLPQIVQGVLYSDKFGGVWFAHAVNKAYLRVRSVADTVRGKDYFEEIISSGLYQYLREEYHKAIDSLGDVSDSHVYRAMWDERSKWKDFINILLHDASLVYYLMAVAINPSSFSLTSLTVMRESANSFAWTIWRLFERDNSLNEKIRSIQDYYSLLSLKTEIVSGYIPYPAPEAMELEGMKLEFRNVSMKYPKSTNFALKNVSFTIPAGATVILVGANGSGKTTTVSLLSRLLDATSGEILIDDRSIKDFDVFTLRDSQAILRQSYQHFPFSVKENIGMGDPRWLKDDEKALGNIEDRIMRAAKLGGADEIIEEIRGLDKKRGEVFKNVLLPKDGVANEKTAEKKDEKEDEAVEAGWDINVTPVTTWEGSWQLHGSKLSDMSEEVEKTLDLSGGQWQRLALARLFMRAERERIRLVCTDEPSAALDPRAEFEVFQRLRNLKGRKTTKIFITHRFGHLTKHADLILCLKKGELVEAGTHDDLMKADGEYATLYNIQAQAFQTS